MKRSVVSALVVLSASIAHAEPRVTIESDSDEITLNQITSEASGSSSYTGGGVAYSAQSFHMVCRVPCNQPVSAQYKYFVGGEGMPRSRKFLLPMEGDVTLKVNSGSNALLAVGVTLVVVGGTVGLSGALGGSITGQEDVVKATAAIGIPLLVAGIVMMVKGGTSVKISRGSGVAFDARRRALVF